MPTWAGASGMSQLSCGVPPKAPARPKKATATTARRRSSARGGPRWSGRDGGGSVTWERPSRSRVDPVGVTGPEPCDEPLDPLLGPTCRSTDASCSRRIRAVRDGISPGFMSALVMRAISCGPGPVTMGQTLTTCGAVSAWHAVVALGRAGGLPFSVAPASVMLIGVLGTVRRHVRDDPDGAARAQDPPLPGDCDQRPTLRQIQRWNHIRCNHSALVTSWSVQIGQNQANASITSTTTHPPPAAPRPGVPAEAPPRPSISPSSMWPRAPGTAGSSPRSS